MYDVVAIGELLIDFTTASLQPDGYPVMAAHPGGAVANFLAPLAKYGKKTALISKVGKDAFGQLLLDTVSSLGIDVSGVHTTAEAFTTLAFVTLDSAGDRSFSFARKPGADTCLAPADLDLTLIDSAKVLHFGSVSMTAEPSRSACKEAVRYAKSKGKLISYDPNLREPLWDDPEEARSQILWGLSLADVVKISDNEVEFLFGLPPAEGLMHMLRTFRAKLVFVTCGKEGCFFANRNGSGFVSNYTEGVETIDTTGAGDIFGGSALYRLLQLEKAPEDLTPQELSDIASFACKAASLSTAKAGGLSSVPDLSEVL